MRVICVKKISWRFTDMNRYKLKPKDPIDWPQAGQVWMTPAFRGAEGKLYLTECRIDSEGKVFWSIFPKGSAYISETYIMRHCRRKTDE